MANIKKLFTVVNTLLEKLARDKRSNLLWKVVTYGRKKCYNIGHRWKFLYDFL
jgi:hypothetical protein